MDLALRSHWGLWLAHNGVELICELVVQVQFRFAPLLQITFARILEVFWLVLPDILPENVSHEELVPLLFRLSEAEVEQMVDLFFLDFVVVREVHSGARSFCEPL